MAKVNNFELSMNTSRVATSSQPQHITTCPPKNVCRKPCSEGAKFQRKPSQEGRTHLVPYKQGDRRHLALILLARLHLLEELYFLLARQKVDGVLAEHHDGVRQLVAKQPGLGPFQEQVKPSQYRQQ